MPLKWPMLLVWPLQYVSVLLGYNWSPKNKQWNHFQVVLVANSLPALNDVTAMELPEIVAEAAKVSQLDCLWVYNHME